MTTVQESVIKAAKLEVIAAACGICSLTEEQLLERLEDLYFKGFQSGGEACSDVLKSVSGELSKIVLAHLKGDQELLKTTLEDFCKRHVAFVPAANSKTTH